MTLKTRRSDGLREAGELVAVEALDRTGLVVTSDGGFVRVLRVTPPNPLILSSEDRQAVAAGFCHLIGRLQPGQSVQFYVDARPVQLRRCSQTRAERSRRRRGRRLRASARRGMRRRSRAGGCMPRWRSRCACMPTSWPQSSSARTWSSRTCRASTQRARSSRSCVPDGGRALRSNGA